MFVLDVGCGVLPVGDVNCDFAVRDFEGHRGGGCYKGFEIDLKSVSNFVLCDAHFLPFKDGSFDLVASRQVIEHVKKPFLMASELVRVSRDLVVVETVHRRGERLQTSPSQDWFRVHHVNKFDFTVLGGMAKFLGMNVVKSDVICFLYYCRFFGFSFFRVPYLIRVVWSKKTDDFYSYFRSKAKRVYLGDVGFGSED